MESTGDLDPRIKERLSAYAGEQRTVRDRLEKVAKPPRMDPRIAARLRAVTR